MRQSSGFFLTLEGGEGTGKSTNSQFIMSWLKNNNIECMHTREPGGTNFAEKIRDLLLNEHEEKISHLTELLLVFAARAQHIDILIKPALKQGKVIVCERFTDATYAYQGGGRGIDFKKISQLEKMVQGEFRPNLTIFLDAPAELGMTRAKNRGDLDRIEQENIIFFTKIRDTYNQRIKSNTNSNQNYAVIDTTQPLIDVQQKIEDILTARFIKNHDES